MNWIFFYSDTLVPGYAHLMEPSEESLIVVVDTMPGNRIHGIYEFNSESDGTIIGKLIPS